MLITSYSFLSLQTVSIYRGLCYSTFH